MKPWLKYMCCTQVMLLYASLHFRRNIIILYFVLHFVYLMGFVTILTECFIYSKLYPQTKYDFCYGLISCSVKDENTSMLTNYNQMFKYMRFIGTFGSFNSHTLYFYLL